MPSWVIRFRRSASAERWRPRMATGQAQPRTWFRAPRARLYGVASSAKHQLSAIEASTTNGGIGSVLVPFVDQILQAEPRAEREAVPPGERQHVLDGTPPLIVSERGLGRSG